MTAVPILCLDTAGGNPRGQVVESVDWRHGRSAEHAWRRRGRGCSGGGWWWLDGVHVEAGEAAGACVREAEGCCSGGKGGAWLAVHFGRVTTRCTFFAARAWRRTGAVVLRLLCCAHGRGVFVSWTLSFFTIDHVFVCSCFAPRRLIGALRGLCLP